MPSMYTRTMSHSSSLRSIVSSEISNPLIAYGEIAMTLIALQRERKPKGEVIDLFENQAPKRASGLRKDEQRERLADLARRLSEMLDKLDAVLKVDRERAVALLAEYSGLLEVAVEDISCIREIDETFGGRGRRVPRIAALSEKLEKGLAYLVGMFSVVSSGERLPAYSWKLIERDVQMVLGISHAICEEICPTTVKEAA